MSLPPSKTVNAFQLAKSTNTVSLSREFGLSRIDISYTELVPEQPHTIIVPPKRNKFVFIIKGSGQLKVGDVSKSVSGWDCFGIPARENQWEAQLVPALDGLGIVVFNDVENSKMPINNDAPTFPTVINTRAAVKSNGQKGPNLSSVGSLTRLSDIQRNENGKKLDNAWNVNIEILPGGTQSSDAHAHNIEDELAFILEGRARYFHHGEVPEPVLGPGDAVGWIGGTGITHTLLADRNDPPTGDEGFTFLVWGEFTEEDKCYYLDPVVHGNPEKQQYRWHSAPKIPHGPARLGPTNARSLDE